MKPILTIAIVASILGFVTAAQGQDQENQTKPAAEKPIELPESGSTAVFTMEFSGGFRPQAADLPRDPHLQIFADGRVVIPQESEDGKPGEFKLTPKQLQDFLKQVVNKNQFYELDTEKIKADVAAAGPAARIADAPTLEITMNLPGRIHAVSVYTPKSTAKQLPKVKSIQQIAKIKALGDKLFLVARAGGYKNVERALSQVNEKLKEKGLDLMTVDQLYTCRTKDEVMTINFNRKYYKPNGRWRDWVDAKFIVDGDDENVVIKTNIDKDKKESKPPKKAVKPSTP